MNNDLSTSNGDALMREHQVLALVPISRSTLHRLIASGDFPAGAKIAPKVRVWRRGVVLEWLDRKLCTAYEGSGQK